MLTHRRRANIIALALLLLGLVVLLGRILLAGQVLADSDILVYYYPVKTAIRGLFLRGESLLWNPLMGEGQPLAANPEHEIFYPFTWLIFAMPVRWALAVSEVAHLGLAFWGALRFFRKRRASEAASILGSVSWSFGGLLVSSIHFYPILYPWTWIPWLAEIALERTFSWGALARGALFGALIVLAGEPVTALMAAAVYAAVWLEAPFNAERLRLAALTAVLALGLSCATWLPGAALAKKGARIRGIPSESADARSFPPVRLAEFLLPRATGDVRAKDDRLYLGWRLYAGNIWPFYWGLYAGVLLLPLAVAGMFSRRRPAVLAFAGLLAFVLSLGPGGVLWSAGRRFLPLWRGIRYPEKFLAVTVFALVAALVSGFDLVRKDRRALRIVCVFLLGLGALLFALSSAPASWEFALRARPHLWRGFALEDAREAVQAVLRRGSWRYLLLGGLLWLLGRLPRRGARSRLVLTLLVLAASVDALTSSRDFIGTRPAEWMEAPPPVIRRLRAVSPTPRLVDLLPAQPPEPFFGRHLQNGGFERNRVLFNQPVQWGVPLALDEDFDLTYLASTDRAREVILKCGNADPRTFSRLLAGRGACAMLVWYSPVTLQNPVGLLGVSHCRPEVDSKIAIVPFQGNDGFLEAVRRYPGDLAAASLVEGSSALLPAVPAPARIENVVSHSASLSFRTESSGTSLIRIARSNDGNWRAKVDEKPWPLHTVDLSLVGIAVPPGSHEVRLTYRDDVLRAGMSVSAASLLVLAVVLASGRRRDPSLNPSAGGRGTS